MPFNYWESYYSIHGFEALIKCLCMHVIELLVKYHYSLHDFEILGKYINFPLTTKKEPLHAFEPLVQYLYMPLNY